MAFVVFISNIFLNQSFNKAQKIKKIISLIIPKCSIELHLEIKLLQILFVTWYTFIYIARNEWWDKFEISRYFR